MELLLIVLVLIAVYFWAKYTFFKVDLSRNVEVFPSRGAPLVKRSKYEASQKQAVRPYTAAQGTHHQEKIDIPPIPAPLHKAITTEYYRGSKPKLPEDVVLRRHFLTQLKAEIVANLAPKPTDFSLVRHYESMLQAEIEKALEGEA